MFVDVFVVVIVVAIVVVLDYDDDHVYVIVYEFSLGCYEKRMSGCSDFKYRRARLT